MPIAERLKFDRSAEEYIVTTRKTSIVITVIFDKISLSYSMTKIYILISLLKPHFIQIASCLRAFPLLWDVASARE